MPSASDGTLDAPPASLQGSCSICFEDLRQSDKISAIVCGHIYHHGCISQWIAAKRQCPSCRRTVPKNGFVEKLFFDVQRSGGEQQKPQEIDYREEHYKLSTTLKVEKEKSEKLEEENKNLKSEVKSLEKKVHKEQNRYRTEVPKLQATINHLTISSEETEYLKRELRESKDKLKASEFYKILTTNSDQAEKQLGEYLRKSGSLDTEKFFQLQKAQIKDLTEKRREAAKEIEQLKSENHSLKRKVQEEAAARKTLKTAILELQDRPNVATPINNKRLREVMESDTPQTLKRRSLGFDESSQLIEGELSFFEHKENKTTPVEPHAEDDDDAEYFRTPKVVEKKKKLVEKQKPVNNDDSFEFQDMPQVPQSIINRIPAKIPAKIPTKIPIKKMTEKAKISIPKLSSKESFEFNLLQPTSRIISKPIGESSSQKITEKTLKRYQSADNPKNGAPPTKNPRIPSFFKRTTSSTTTSTDCVTID
ncbi:hypothetical protein CRE_17899 [Caenorhabditis remanei]|uniref:RING-type domain-containing protein n=1 Tax=Caenorhabditis remanei TaxID=31234 RepID=E3MDF3_CAERE|nr:hypothetical protein CRE_17899 [Caenorhabditis remanei]